MAVADEILSPFTPNLHPSHSPLLDVSRQSAQHKEALMSRFRTVAIAAFALLLAAAAFAQVTPAAGSTPPDDTPKFNIGALLFADYTYQNSPKITDADKNSVNASSFNVARAYINVTGNLNHFLSFRITPDIARDTSSGNNVSGSQIFRLKYAYGQLNLDDWTTHGSFLRLGVQQTPYIDYTEGIYRYRFQGTIFPERAGFMSSADAGFSGHWNFPNNYGDVHAGFYNGENYNKAETNNQKGFEIRGTLRPMPLGGIWKGLRLTGFAIQDHYVNDAKRERHLGQISYEHPLVNAAIEFLQAKDQTLTTARAISAKGWSAWATPRLGTSGWEMLLRRDSLEPDKTSSRKQTRDIVGIAYWLPGLTRVTTSLMFDVDSLKTSGVTPKPTDVTNYAVHMLINF
jgi:hypothetical protein